MEKIRGHFFWTLLHKEKNFEAFKGIEKNKKVEIFLVFPNPMGMINQKNLWPKSIYQFEHSGTP